MRSVLRTTPNVRCAPNLTLTAGADSSDQLKSTVDHRVDVAKAIAARPVRTRLWVVLEMSGVARLASVGVAHRFCLLLEECPHVVSTAHASVSVGHVALAASGGRATQGRLATNAPVGLLRVHATTRSSSGCAATLAVAPVKARRTRTASSWSIRGLCGPSSERPPAWVLQSPSRPDGRSVAAPW
jgi:hypothetical protein